MVEGDDVEVGLLVGPLGWVSFGLKLDWFGDTQEGEFVLYRVRRLLDRSGARSLHRYVGTSPRLFVGTSRE